MRIFQGTTIIAAAVLLLASSASLADDELPIPADEYVYCTVCHGVQLMGNSVIRAPRLSEMEDWYVERQLQAFKKGWRGMHEADVAGIEMQPMAADLSSEQIAEVTAFVVKTRSDLPTDTVRGSISRGRHHYTTCAACHGEDGQGNQALGGPALTNVDDWYLVTQLQNFKNGSRGAHPDDSYGNQMRAAAQILADDEAVNDVVSYIATFKNN
jgi:cytochrome c oxidase subunit 2